MPRVLALAGILILPLAVMATDDNLSGRAKPPDTVDTRVALLIDKLAGGNAAVVKPLEGHAGLRAYLLENTERGHQYVVYATADGSHLITGRIFDSTGEDLTAGLMAEHVKPVADDIVLRDAEKTYFVEEGRGGRILYVVADVNCGYCKKLHGQLKPRIAAGEVTVRWVMVDILRRDGSSARVLAADRNGRGVDALDAAMAGDTSWLAELAEGDHANSETHANETFMHRHRITGTPFLVWESQSGSVQTIAGAPRDLEVVLATLKGQGDA